MLNFFIICSVDVKKDKKKKYSENECVACIIFMNVFFYDKIARIKKNLIF